MASRSTLLSIQYLRAFAAIAVLVAHSGKFDVLLGQQGVDVFFVISGFVMMLVSRRETTPQAFVAARFFLIAPLYWIATLAWWALHPELSVGHIALSLGFISHIGPEGMIWPAIWQGWSLLFEVWFYVLFAITLLAPARMRLFLLSATIVLLAGIGLFTQASDAFSQVYTSPLSLEFLAGAWLYAAWNCEKLQSPIIGAACVAMSLVGFLLTWRIPIDLFRFAYWGVPSLLLVAGLLSIERFIPASSVLLLGNASYAIYLTHRFVIGQIDHSLHYWPSAALAGIILGTIAFGCAVHLLIEKPLTGLINRRRKSLPLPDQGTAHNVV